MYKKLRINSEKENFLELKEKLENYDIVYDIQNNAGIGYNIIKIFKRPDGISDYDLACEIDGFYYYVFNRGGYLECWYD